MTSLTCTSIPHNSFGYPSFISYTGILMCVKVQEVGLKHRRFLSNIYQIYKFCYSSVHQDQLLLLAHWLSPCTTCGIQQKSVIFYLLRPQILTLISNHQLCKLLTTNLYQNSEVTSIILALFDPQNEVSLKGSSLVHQFEVIIRVGL